MTEEGTNKVYVGDVGLAIIVDVGEDIEGATNTYLKVRKPDGTTDDWAAEVHTVSGDTNYLRYYTEEGDLDQSGRYKVQAYLTIDDWTGRGETTEFRVYAVFK